MKIRKDDNVIVIAGKDKGKKGKVLKVFPLHKQLLVEGVNMKKKHQRGSRANQKGQIVEKINPVHISNVMLLDPKSGKPTRVGFTIEGGKKMRVARQSGSVIS